jgi:DHA1 family bicyclomycin/chloramphenicol resistance-like MFS transporter
VATHTEPAGLNPMKEAKVSSLAFMLGGLALVGPLSVDAYLPAFSHIERSFNVGAHQVQFTLTAYLFAFAIMSLWHGALSDALGRRNVVLGSLAVFSIASLGCAAAPDLNWLWVFRVLQGVSAGAGTVVGRAIIRDLHAGPLAARLLSLVSMIFSLSPAVAPVIGGWIVTNFQWRAIFVFLFVYTASLLMYCFRYLTESLSFENRRPLEPKRLLSDYRRVFASPTFQRGAGAIAFNFAGLFLYVAAAPVFLGTHLGLSSEGFAWEFMPLVAGIFLGSLGAERMAGKVSQGTQIASGFAIMMASSVANVAFHTVHAPALPWSIAPLLFYSFGMSVIAPSITLMVLDLFPNIRGLVASCQAFTMVLLAALVTGFVAPALDRSVLWLAAGQMAFGLVGLGLWILELGAVAESNLSPH